MTLPSGLSYASDDASGTSDGSSGTVIWEVGTLSSGDSGDTTTQLTATASGTYSLSAELTWYVEATAFSTMWMEDVEVLLDSDDDGLFDEEEESEDGGRRLLC